MSHIAFVVKEKAENEIPDDGISGESVFVYWLKKYATQYDISILNEQEYSNLSTDHYSYVIINQLVKDNKKDSNRIWWSHANFPQEIIKKLNSYRFVLHNNYFLYLHTKLYKRLIFLPLTSPIPKNQNKKRKKFIYVGNFATYKRKATPFLDQIRDNVDIYGDKGWRSEYPKQYKGSISLDLLLGVYNSYQYSICLHKEINKIFGEINLPYFMSLACQNAFYIDDVNYNLIGNFSHDIKNCNIISGDAKKGLCHVQSNVLENYMAQLLTRLEEKIPNQIEDRISCPDYEFVSNGERYRKHVMGEEDTMWSLFGEDWEKIYYLPVNSCFRSLHPNPNIITPRSIINVPLKRSANIF